MRKLAACALVLLIAGLLFKCSPLSETQKLERMADQTQVCVQNDREFTVTVEIRDSNTGTEYASIYAPSFAERCEWTNLEAGELVHGVIDAVGLRRDVVPPAWRHMMVGSRTMRLTIGADGLTRFSHSSRMQ